MIWNEYWQYATCSFAVVVVWKVFFLFEIDIDHFHDYFRIRYTDIGLKFIWDATRLFVIEWIRFFFFLIFSNCDEQEVEIVFLSSSSISFPFFFFIFILKKLSNETSKFIFLFATEGDKISFLNFHRYKLPLIVLFFVCWNFIFSDELLNVD